MSSHHLPVLPTEKFLMSFGEEFLALIVVRDCFWGLGLGVGGLVGRISCQLLESGLGLVVVWGVLSGVLPIFFFEVGGVLLVWPCLGLDMMFLKEVLLWWSESRCFRESLMSSSPRSLEFRSRSIVSMSPA